MAWKLYVLLGWVLLSLAASRDCIKRDQCACAFDDDASVIDITSIGNSNNTPRFKDVAGDDGVSYSYNPCYPFDEGDCKAAASCRVNGSDYQQIGNATKVEYQLDADTGDVIAAYSSQTQTEIRITSVVLSCDPSACVPTFTAAGLQPDGIYEMTLTTACACANGCDSSGPVNCGDQKAGKGRLPGGLSAGSFLLIVFACIIVLYLVVGSVYMKVVRRAQGAEIFPNIALWRSVCGNIQAGVDFVTPCCGKDSTRYDQI